MSSWFCLLIVPTKVSAGVSQPPLGQGPALMKIKAKEGTPVLWAALDNGLYIPNLCAVREIRPPFASCRLCFVEIEGRGAPVTACTEPVSDGMVVNLNTKSG